MANSFDYNNTIGSWSSPDTSSSNRGGWNVDGSNKNGGVFDDGTAIWGNPTTKKTGVDWTEKESSLSTPQPQTNNSNSEGKRLQKNEPIISSINGTEAWGAPVRSPPTTQQINSHLQQQQQQQQQHQNQQQQQSQQQQQQQLDSATAGPFSSAAAPSRDLLKQMVHQIQLAVQAGHLNAHILNQPMSTPTLQLVYQLLQQIKTLHQLQEIQQRAGMNSPDLSSSNEKMLLDLQINRIRQNISLLQKAITQQQTALTKNETTTIGDSTPSPPQQQQQPPSSSSLTTAAAAVAANNINKQQQQQQQANNYSYATISKLSTNLKVPPTSNATNNMSNIISNSNLDSFRRSSLIDTLSNSNSDSLRSAQANFEASAAIDKTLSSIIQASSANNILGRNKTITTSGDFSKAQQSFTGSGIVSQQVQSKGLISAQSSSSSSSSSSAWPSAFSSGDFVAQQQQQGWPSHLRISSNVSQDHEPQYNTFDTVPDFGAAKAWRNSSILSDHVKDSSSMAPGGNIITARPNSASNTLKQMNENDILNNRDSSLFCDWSNNSDASKRNFDQISSAASAFSSSAIGGLSLQSTPWMFSNPTSSTLGIGGGIGGSGLTSGLNKNSIIGNGNVSGTGGNLNNLSNILDYGNTDKMAGDSLFRSSSALYDWGDLTSSTLQLSADNNHWGKQQSCSTSSSGGIGGHPAPPPGL